MSSKPRRIASSPRRDQPTMIAFHAGIMVRYAQWLGRIRKCSEPIPGNDERPPISEEFIGVFGNLFLTMMISQTEVRDVSHFEEIRTAARDGLGGQQLKMINDILDGKIPKLIPMD